MTALQFRHQRTNAALAYEQWLLPGIYLERTRKMEIAGFPGEIANILVPEQQKISRWIS
jgi:hypothetical protein